MPELDLNELHRIGSVRDTKAFMLPPEAWTTALNVRMEDDQIKRLPGWEQCFGTPSVAPHFLLPITGPNGIFWLYTSLTKGYVYDGTNHTNITRQSAGVDVNYTASETREWNGTILGGVPILNNGVDVPQFWTAALSLATKLANLTNWSANVRAKVLRAYGPFLIALHVTDTGTTFPHLVRWSHPADPGSVPSSWDATDPTKDTGQLDLADVNSGLIRDGMQLGGYFFVYKDQSTWRARFVGGRKIFDFGDGAWLTTSGILAARCMCPAVNGTVHVVATQEDIIWHDGNQRPQSILDRRWRSALYNQIDTTNYANSFMFDNTPKREVWFCYPSTGQTNPDRGLILNYSDFPKWAITEVDGITFRNAALGPIQSPASDTWDSDSTPWDSEVGPWEEIQRRRLVVASPSNTKFYNLDKGITRDGSAFDATLRREALALLGKKRNGELIVDFEIVKLFTRLWPKVSGGPVRVRVGSQMLVDGAISWGSYYSFDPTTGEITRPLGVTADPLPVAGRAISIEFSTTASVDWGLSGYKINIEALGMF